MKLTRPVRTEKQQPEGPRYSQNVEALVTGQSRIMEMVACGKPLPLILDALVRFIESQSPGLLCSIHLLDSDGATVRFGAAVGVPMAFSQGIDGQKIGPAAGSCGTAAFLKREVVAEDIANDPLWADYRDLALQQGLRACWSTPVQDSDGEILGTFAIYYRKAGRPAPRHKKLVGIATHIAAVAISRTRRESALRSAEDRYRTTLDTILEGCQIIAFDWSYLYLNHAAALHNRRPNTELLGRKMPELWPGIEETPLFAMLRRCMNERIPLHQEIEFSFPDGGKGWFDVRTQPVPEGIFVLSIDVTVRRRAEAALAWSERRFRDMLETVDLIAVMLDSRGAIAFCNEHLLHLTGYRREELIGAGWLDTFLPWTEPKTKALFLATIESGTFPRHRESKIRTKHGEIREIVWNNTVLRDATGTVAGTASIGEDVTDRKQAERRLDVQYAVNSVLANSGPSQEINPRILETLCRGLNFSIGGLWMVDKAANVLRCVEVWHSPSVAFDAFSAVSRQYSFEPGLGLPGSVWASGQAEWSADTALDPRCRRREHAARLELRAWVGFPVRIRNETVGVLELFGAQARAPDQAMLAMLGAIGAQVGQFIERRQLAEQFRQAQKMEAIGTLAGGIAHDFNNVLSSINGYTELAMMEAGDNPELVEYLTSVMSGSKRAVDLVRQILAFSRQQEPERKAIQLEGVVEETLKLLRAAVPPSIRFEVSIEQGLPAVMADATQIHQIAMNLCTNASHAMKSGTGRLTVKLDRFKADPEFAASLPGLRAGPGVRLTVSDTGHGMEPQTITRIFEPFFTTKPPGEGTGLGLSVVHGIMQSHEGAISVSSRPGQGTTFLLYFPEAAGRRSEEAVAGRLVPRGHGERILFVDDEAALANIAKKILERLGYAVDARTSPGDALSEVLAGPETYDLVVTDMMMPGMSGVALAERLYAIRPGLPVIIATGYGAALPVDEMLLPENRSILMKPLSVDSLGSAVSSALAKSKAG